MWKVSLRRVGRTRKQAIILLLARIWPIPSHLPGSDPGAVRVCEDGLGSTRAALMNGGIRCVVSMNGRKFISTDRFLIISRGKLGT